LQYWQEEQLSHHLWKSRDGQDDGTGQDRVAQADEGN